MATQGLLGQVLILAKVKLEGMDVNDDPYKPCLAVDAVRLMFANPELVGPVLNNEGRVEALQMKPTQYLPGTSAALIVVIFAPVEVITESIFTLVMSAPVES